MGEGDGDGNFLARDGEDLPGDFPDLTLSGDELDLRFGTATGGDADRDRQTRDKYYINMRKVVIIILYTG